MLEFPCEFPDQDDGSRRGEFPRYAAIELVEEPTPGKLPEDEVIHECRPASKRQLRVDHRSRLTPRARRQLDDIYQALTAHEDDPGRVVIIRRPHCRSGVCRTTSRCGASDAVGSRTSATTATPDEIWFTEHPAGLHASASNASREHLLAPGTFPVVQVDRGGQVTYHGPGPVDDLSADRSAAIQTGGAGRRHRRWSRASIDLAGRLQHRRRRPERTRPGYT